MALEDNLLDSDNTSADETDQLRWYWKQLLPRRLAVSIIALLGFGLLGLGLCLLFWEFYHYWARYWEELDMPWLYYTRLSELLILVAGAIASLSLFSLALRYLISHSKETRYSKGEMEIADFMALQMGAWRTFALVLSLCCVLVISVVGFSVYVAFMPMQTDAFIPQPMEEAVWEEPIVDSTWQEAPPESVE